jgi:hypothetical protein
MADNHGDRMTGAWLSPLQVLCDTQIFWPGARSATITGTARPVTFLSADGRSEMPTRCLARDWA